MEKNIFDQANEDDDALTHSDAYDRMEAKEREAHRLVTGMVLAEDEEALEVIVAERAAKLKLKQDLLAMQMQKVELQKRRLAIEEANVAARERKAMANILKEKGISVKAIQSRKGQEVIQGMLAHRFEKPKVEKKD